MPRTRADTTESAAKRAKPDGIQVGDKIPAVTLKDQSGVEHSLGEIDGILVIFAYPKASTPGCTKQTRGFNESLEEFTEVGAKVFGLSADTEKAQTTFKNKLELGFDLLSDPQYELIEPLGAKKSPKGVIRSHWVFKDGVCTLVEHSVKPDASPVASLEQVKSLSGGGETKAETEAAATGAESEAATEIKEPEVENGKLATDSTEASEATGDAESAKGSTDTATDSKKESTDEPEQKESVAEIVRSKVEAKLKNAEDDSKSIEESENSDFLAKAAAKVVAEVVTKITADGKKVDVNNVQVKDKESTKLKEAKEDDRAQQAEADGEPTEVAAGESKEEPAKETSNVSEAR